MKEFANFEEFSREKWQSLYDEGIPPLTQEELEEIKSLNDKISLKDVEEVFVPIAHLVRIYMKAQEQLSLGKSLFARKFVATPPFIIGVSGSVAVGKSTVARLLQILLTRTFKRFNVELITTDGFLLSTQELIEKDLLDRKGFPESYDMERLLNFLYDVKSSKEFVSSPVYSHEIYDIVKGKEHITHNPNILIVEGINVLQLPQNEQVYVSDFFDFSVYVDASEDNIRKWYFERFEKLLDGAFQDESNYYYSYASLPRTLALQEADKVWKTVNKVNLEQYILPTRSRADVILQKNNKHVVDTIYLRKY